MPNKIQFKRGLKASLPDLDAGEPGYCTDTQELFIGNSTGSNKKVVMAGEMAYNVKDYGAKGDGITDDGQAVLAAVALAAVTGGTIVFPPSSTPYKLDTPIDLVINSVEIEGFGATIDCRGTGSVFGVNGQGGGFTVTGNNVAVRGLSFIGYPVAQGGIDYKAGKLLNIIGNSNVVEDCNFNDGNGGAVHITGNKNLVTECNFDGCNNHASEGADYGSIQMLGGYGNRIIGCWMENQYYAGICLNGPLTKTTIDNCYIKATNPLGLNTSMGIYSFNGSGHDLVITNCTIEDMAAEAIVIFSSIASPSDSIKIANNTLRDYKDYAIAIYDGDGGASTNVKIEHNLCQSRAVSPGQHIFTEMLKRSSICNNTIVGSETVVGTIGTGIYVGSSPASNIVKNNSIFNLNVGIFFADTLGGDVSENMVILCATGIQYQNCERAKITNNNIVDCTTAFNRALNSIQTYVADNMVSGHTTVSNAPMLYGDVQTTAGATTPFATGTLVAGSATITFYNIDDGDVFVVVPFTYLLQASCGSLYIAEQNSSSDTMIIKSTNAADTRKFAVIKIARGLT